MMYSYSRVYRCIHIYIQKNIQRNTYCTQENIHTTIDIVFTDLVTYCAGNVAFLKYATQPSVDRSLVSNPPHLAVDGDGTTYIIASSSSQDDGINTPPPWWTIDLGAFYVIEQVNIYIKLNACNYSGPITPLTNLWLTSGLFLLVKINLNNYWAKNLN